MDKLNVFIDGLTKVIVKAFISVITEPEQVEKLVDVLSPTVIERLKIAIREIFANGAIDAPKKGKLDVELEKKVKELGMDDVLVPSVWTEPKS